MARKSKQIEPKTSFKGIIIALFVLSCVALVFVTTLFVVNLNKTSVTTETVTVSEETVKPVIEDTYVSKDIESCFPIDSLKTMSKSKETIKVDICDKVYAKFYDSNDALISFDNKTYIFAKNLSDMSKDPSIKIFTLNNTDLILTKNLVRK